MRTLKSTAIVLVMMAHAGFSQKNYPFYLEGGLAPGMQANYFTGGVGGAFGLFLNGSNSLDFRARELYNVKQGSVVSTINFTYRYHFKSGLFMGAGFAHHHEIGAGDYMQNAADASMGTHKSIRHRSGIGAEIGYNWPALAEKGFFARVNPTINLAANYMIGDVYLNPLVTANVGLRIGLGKYSSLRPRR